MSRGLKHGRKQVRNLASEEGFYIQSKLVIELW